MYVAPPGRVVRVDSHRYAGYVIPSNYDSMVAKLVAHGKIMKMAVDYFLDQALSEYIIEGPRTTIGFHQRLIRDARFATSDYTTKFVDVSMSVFWFLCAVYLLKP